ncbi:type I-U CRISPR-associated protein Csx17 [Schlesneria sp. DSM 10557]|uniref:type I-G CRISPR-associated protein Cas8g1/Csx17 n=1 Tax=Schlesneria sp. DSM 10557 TaxID=3044399 RepID=UPI0035A012EA
MPKPTHVHQLTGCTPTPLAGYLKALGILRLVATQADEHAQGWWSGDVFFLRTTLDSEHLEDFFLNQYRPSPLVAPWNGGSGFFPKDNQSAISQLCQGKATRLAVYRETIAACRDVLSNLGLKEKPDGGSKERLLIACRANLPDDAVVSLDAAFVLTDDGPKYPPLLGTGFNDGRLEFTNNFMQRLLDLIDPETGHPTDPAAEWWSEALFPDVCNNLQKNAILGQFDPGAVERAVNPWDYVLMLEGALAFATATVKRLESSTKGCLSYPFCVRAAGIGYGSSAASDEGSSRAEMWFPLWSNPCTHSELQSLLSEGRVQVNGRPARNAIDFARSVSTLGIARGVDQFIRFGFHARNGLAYFAVPLGRFEVKPQPQVNLLCELDNWLDRFRRSATADTAPSRAGRALRQLETAILALCQHKGAQQLQAVLIALGEAEATLAVSRKWRTDSGLRPVPLLSGNWLLECDDGSNEFRLAISLASMFSKAVGDFRQHLEPVVVGGRNTEGRSRWVEWNEDSSAERQVVWNAGRLEDNLSAVLQRRITDAKRHDERSDDGTVLFPGRALISASLDHVVAFLKHKTDDARIGALLRGLVLIDWGGVKQAQTHKQIDRSPSLSIPDGMYALMKLCHSPRPVGTHSVQLDSVIANRGISGNGAAALRSAARRLRGSGLSPSIEVASRSADAIRRITAALLFPLNQADTTLLSQLVLTSVPTAAIDS